MKLEREPCWELTGPWPIEKPSNVPILSCESGFNVGWNCDDDPTDFEPNAAKLASWYFGADWKVKIGLFMLGKLWFCFGRPRSESSW